MPDSLSDEKLDADAIKKRMLIVDDEKNMRHMLTSMLKKFGYTVDTAADGTDALKMVGQKTYDFILCDLKMPNKNGMAACMEIRDMDPGVKFVLITGGFYDLDEVQRLELGPILMKPFAIEELLERLAGI